MNRRERKRQRQSSERAAWIAGSSPAMTKGGALSRTHPRASRRDATAKITRTKERKRSAERRIQPWRHRTGAAAHPAGCARLSALHRGSRLGARAPPLSLGPRFALWRSVTSAHYDPCGSHAGLRTLAAAKLSQTPGRPVLVPAGSMPKAAREQVANPPAGTAPAPVPRHASAAGPFTWASDSSPVTEIGMNVK